MKKTISWIIALFAGCSSFAWDGGTTTNDWNQLTNDVEAGRTQLTNLMAQAETAGLNTDYAYVSQVVIERFQVFAQYDFDNPTVMSNGVADIWWGDRIPDSTQYFIQLPFNEMQECLAVASNAIAELSAQLTGNISLQSPVDFLTGTMTLTNDYFAVDGVPSIPSTFTWMPEDDDLIQAFGRMSGSYYQLTNLESDGSVDSSFVTSERIAAFDQTANQLLPQQIFLGGSVDSWMTNASPEVVDGARNFVKYDTDSPLIRGWLTQLFEGLLPDLCGPNGSGDGARMHLLANEPNFATRVGGWLADNGVSANTMHRYNDWLVDTYTTISNLNAIYETSYAGFDAVEAARVIPIDPDAAATIRGGPVWYDWCRFNMDRINDFFDFLKAGTQANDPGKDPVTIKVLGRQFLSGRDEGMDVEYLAKLMDVQGADNQVIPQNMTSLNYKDSMSWTNRYSLNWTGQSTTLDFMRSVSPGKAFYDSEWHGLSTGKWRDFSMDPDYVRAAIWMAATHGMRAMQAWYWPRNTDGSLRKGEIDAMIGSIVTLPSALDAYGRTFKELNAHGQSVVSLIPDTRYYMIYHCEEAAIQDDEYVTGLEAVYEAVKLLNVPVGFVTPSTFSDLSSSVHTVIMPPAEFVSDDSLAKLQAFEASGGRVVQINGDVTSFAKDELGFARESSGLSLFANVAYSAAVFPMAEELENALSEVKPSLAVRVGITDSDGSKAYGVLALQTSDAETGQTTVCLMNVSKDVRAVNLSMTSGDAANYRDLLTRQLVASSQTMEPYDVLLLQTEEVAQPIVQWGEPGGDSGIVSSSQDFSDMYNTYTVGNTVNPSVGTNYYPNRINRSPVFNHAASNAWNVKQVSDGGDGPDFITTAKNDSNYSAMVVWEDFLTNRTVLAGLAIETRVSNSTDTPSQFRWLIQKSGIAWYASAATDTTSSFVSYTNNSPEDLTWYSFTPFVNGEATVGSEVPIDMTDITAVGYYATFQQTASNVAYRANHTRYFHAAATTPGSPNTGWADFVSDYGLSGVATNDFDGDGQNDLLEYGLGGNATNPAIVGTNPYTTSDAESVSFFHLKLTNSHSGITYIPEWTDDLVHGLWTNEWSYAGRAASTNQGFDQVECQLDWGQESNLFFRLRISQP